MSLKQAKYFESHDVIISVALAKKNRRTGMH
jgi:hypothetical protein